MSREAWLIAKGTSSIRVSCSKKTSKMCRNIGIFWHWPETAISNHILDVFSEQGSRIELIPFAMSQASRNTSLDYPQHIIPRTLKIHFLRVDPPWGTPKIIFWQKNYFPIFLFILVTTLNTCWNNIKTWGGICKPYWGWVEPIHSHGITQEKDW